MTLTPHTHTHRPLQPGARSGTVRHNLDPFAQYGDDALWEALESVGLKPIIAELEARLDANVVDGGANFSQGQRQLFCLARAMLRRSRILMLDEATASIDPETDALLQRAIRSVFGDCTQLTIAHRLNTIADNDRVLVMDDGRVAEDDEPHALLAAGGLFASLVEQTGASSAKYLREVSRAASEARRAAGGRRGLLLPELPPPPPADADAGSSSTASDPPGSG